MAATVQAITPDAIRALLLNRVEESKRANAIVVGRISPEGRQVFSQGPADGDTFFEIGSITKVFTSLLLADMVERGEVTLDTPVGKLLPPEVKAPSRNGRQITLLDLSTQTSGLPRMPTNFHPADPENPFADYNSTKLYEFLSSYTLTRDIGEKYEYSNLGAGLLGHVLARKAGMPYEQLLRKRILDPLGMKDTTITLSEVQSKRLTPGHNAKLETVKNWDLDALAGAGAIRSTANDMLKFLAANMELSDTPLKSAMRRMRSVHRETGTADLQILMAWHDWTKYGTEIVWHNGGTAGYRTFAGFAPEKKTGVVVLSNTQIDIDDIGLHILEEQWPAPKLEPKRVYTEVKVAPEVLEKYVGEYQLGQKFSIKVTRESDRLFVQATGQPRFEAFAASESEFFLKVVEAQITFNTDALVLHQGGMKQRATKIQ